MASQTTIDEESAAVQVHLEITQSIIQRMASNSTSCKASCITLVSAVLVIVADENKANYAYLALIPNVLFFALDAYYLALERCFRQSYNTFIEKLHERRTVVSDLFAVTPIGSLWKTFFASLLSPSVWPLYATLAAMIWLAKRLVLE